MQHGYVEHALKDYPSSGDKYRFIFVNAFDKNKSFLISDTGSTIQYNAYFGYYTPPYLDQVPNAIGGTNYLIKQDGAFHSSTSGPAKSLDFPAFNWTIIEFY